MTQRNFNPIMAMAAKITIVEVEDEIVEVGQLDPDQIHVSGVYVNRIIKIPPDGIFN
jgi:acyl CoA:acetate/3-ketoacid CoA transferase alpha subunit